MLLVLSLIFQSLDQGFHKAISIAKTISMLTRPQDQLKGALTLALASSTSSIAPAGC